MKATQQLKDEHQGIKIVFRILEKICEKLKADGTLNAEHFEGILEFFKVFVDKCHHGKEEDLLFPAMEQVGIPRQGPIGVMLAEHAMGRKLCESDQRGLFRIQSRQKRPHLPILLKMPKDISRSCWLISIRRIMCCIPWETAVFQKKQQEALYEGFEKIEIERIGIGKHEEFHGMIDKLSKIYL